MRPRDLLHKFIAIAPDFESYWRSRHNCFRQNDGSFTLHGVCAEFSDFFHEQYEALSEDQLTELFWLIEHCLDDPDEYGLPVDNALCTCFLENISSEPCGQFAKPFMGPISRSFFDQWHVGPPY